jgi:uncharacterized protein (DUF362 family)
MLNIVQCNSYDKLFDLKSNSPIWQGWPKVEGKKVFVKPNLGIPPSLWDAQSVTHQKLIDLVLSRLVEEGAKSVVVGCCGYRHQWDKTLAFGGYDLICKKEGTTLICVQDGENFHKYTMVRLKKYLSLFGTKVSNYLLEADVVINLPKLKVGYLPGFTCAIKNMMGVISPKGTMHPQGSISILMKRLHDLYFLMQPLVDWTMVDGVVGSEYSSIYGVPKKANVLISGNDMWEVDCWAADAMGFDPEFFPYLQYIRKSLERNWPQRLSPKFRTKFELSLGWRKEDGKAGYSGLCL